MQKTLVICLVALTFVVSAVGQTGDHPSAQELQREVTFLLLDKNINDVTKDLDSESATTLASLLRRVVIYSRAGQASKVRKTLEQLASTANWQCQVNHDLKWLLLNAEGTHLDAHRFYYERLCPNQTEGAESFIRLWISEGDRKELDDWLAERSDRNNAWLMQRVQLRAKSGTASEILDALAADVRANPSDWESIDRYLNANSYAGNLQDVKWLAETFAGRTATDYFQLAQRVRNHSPQAGVKLLQKSLELPFTEVDAKLVDDLVNRFRSMGPAIKVNREKQLRYWTKHSLAETYQRMNQSLAAQPLAEELVAMKGDDILMQDFHQLAGAIQAASGHRVVETKLVRDELARSKSSEYWLERAMYYHGRDEPRLQRDSYRQALIALTAKPDDIDGLRERLLIVTSFAIFLSSDASRTEDKPELERLLRRELNSVPAETEYAYQIARLITQEEFELDGLRNSLLAEQPSFLARLLNGRREWTMTEAYFIKDIVDEIENPSQQEKLWSILEPLARDPGSTRAYYLAEAMHASDAWRRTIPLWRGYIEHASNSEDFQSEAIKNLFIAYRETKQWQAAEKLLFAQKNWSWHLLPNALAEVALVAAQQDAIDDAIRLWRLSANLDRRNLDLLPQLSQTKARSRLQELYSQMKKEEPLSTIPDQALRLLH